ncbi:MAG: YueI family protein [Halanaerobiales bacterium]
MADEEKSELEKKVMEGIHGQPELKKGEKDRFLGQFAERVIRYLSYKQVKEDGIYPEIMEALRHPQAAKLLVSRDVDLEQANEYIKLARDKDLTFRRVDSPELKGEVALVVAADEAVNIQKKEVQDRREKLQNLGIPDSIIDNTGGALCPSCWSMLEEKAPEELINYRKINFLEKLLGSKCINCQ